jgi:hypothetical protein
MKNQYFAKPYNGDVTGFYFTKYSDYSEQAASLEDSYGEPVDELELYFIDGDNAQLFNALGINQANLEQWFDELELCRSRHSSNYVPFLTMSCWVSGFTKNLYISISLLQRFTFLQDIILPSKTV